MKKVFVVTVFLACLSFTLNNSLMAATATTDSLSSGVTLTQEQQSFTTSQNLIDSKNTLLALSASVTLEPATDSLYQALQADPTYLANFNLLYGANLQATGLPTDSNVTLLSNITALADYDLADFLVQMNKAASLYSFLQTTTDASYRLNFFQLYSASLPTTGSPSVLTRTQLLSITSNAAYNQAGFLSTMQKAGSLYRYLRASPTHLQNFNLLFKATVQAISAIALNNNDRDLIFDVVSNSTYAPNSFLTNMNKAASLYGALRVDTAKRNVFNTRYSASLPASGSPVPRDRDFLLLLTVDPRYDQASFLASLTPDPDTHIPWTGKQIFSPTSFWNTKLAPNAALSPDSAKFVTDLVRQTKVAPGILYPPAFGSNPYSAPVYVVTDPNIPKVNIRLTANGQIISIRIPPGAVAGGGGDRPFAVWDQVDDTYADFWQMDLANKQATWGGIITNASTSDGIFKNGGGATATGLPHAGFLIKLAELKAGVIPHVVGIQLPQIPNRHVWPAQRHDAAGPFFANSPPEGTRYRFPADIYIDPNWAPIIKMTVIAIRDYGAVQYDRAYSVIIGVENTAQYGETLNQFANGMNFWDQALMAQMPFSKLQVVA